MDRTSYRVLKHIRRCGQPMSRAGRAFLETNPADLFRQWLAVALSVISTVVSIIALCG